MKKFPFKDHGVFEAYTPTTDVMESVLYSRNTETKECWYSAVKRLKDKSTYKFLLNADNRVVGSALDGEHLFPVDLRVIEVFDSNCDTTEFRAKWFDLELGAFYLLAPDGERTYV